MLKYGALLLLLLLFSEVNGQPQPGFSDSFFPEWYLHIDDREFLRDQVVNAAVIAQMNSRISKAGYRGADITVNRYSSDITFDGGEKSFAKLRYDNAGRVIYKEKNTDEGRLYFYLFNHNDSGLVSSYTISSEFSEVFNFEYEKGRISRAKSIIDNVNETDQDLILRYDENGRLNEIQTPSDFSPGGFSTEYKCTYDQTGKAESVFNNFGAGQNYSDFQYDERGRVKQFMTSAGVGWETIEEELYYVGDKTYPMDLVSYRKGKYTFKSPNDGSIITVDYSSEYKYDQWGNLTEIRSCSQETDKTGKKQPEICELYMFKYYSK